MKTFLPHSTILLALLVAGMLLSSCKKEKENDPHVPPAMAFTTGAGYTSANAVVGQQDTLLMEVTVDKTEDALTSLNISSSYDGAASTTVFNESITTDHYVHAQEVITRAQAGTEKYTFTAVDHDGNITSNSILLTVQ
ncbi:MAG: hypothetical protein ABI599_18425 [Flavobacteriales bacterium]